MKLQENVLKVIRENIQFRGEISLDSDLIKDLGIDSFDMLMIVNTLEEEYGIEVDENDLKKLKTVADVINKLEQMLSVKV